jgi:hypothetical protein
MIPLHGTLIVNRYYRSEKASRIVVRDCCGAAFLVKLSDFDELITLRQKLAARAYANVANVDYNLSLLIGGYLIFNSPTVHGHHHFV